jgi:3-oxoadipate enol-lactonase
MDAIPNISVRRVRGRLARPGCDIYYELTGDGPALVFAHGLGGNHLSWWQQVPAFCGRYSCVAFAHRGFAPSSALPGGPHPEDYADDLAALLDHLGFAEARIVAQSMGGWTATGFALRWPARVKALVMACTTGVFDFRQSAHIDKAALAAWDASAERTATEGFAAGIHPAGGARMAREQPAAHFLYRAIDDMNRELDKQALRKRLFATRVRPPSEAKALRFPTLFITGEEDLAIPPAGVAAMAAEFPNARLERVPAAGHSVYFERPDLFNRLVAGLLESAG